MPGAVYDPVADKIVGVTVTNNIVYTLDTATKTCTEQTMSGDNQPAYILRTRPGGGASGTSVPMAPMGLQVH